MKNTKSNLPALEARIKTLERDIQILNRRNENLVERLSELPKDVPADHLYNQMKTNTDKVKDLTTALASLKAQECQVGQEHVDKDALRFKIRRAIQNLEKTPVEKQKVVFGSLIKFAEIYSNKIKLGVYAPVAAIETENQ